MTVLPAQWWRALGPLSWVWLVIGLVLLAGAISDPFGWRARQLERARTQAATGELEARYRLEERSAQQWLSQKQREQQDQQRAVSDMTDKAVAAAREQPDATTQLGEDRLSRLREHDRGLCQRASGQNGCVAATGTAARG